MKTNYKLMGQLLGYYAVLGACFISHQEARAFSNFNMGLSLNYGNGGGYAGGPMFGYGAGAGSFGALNGCFGGAGGLGGFGGGGFMNNGIPPLPVIVPPHLQGGGYMGAGMGGSPYLHAGMGMGMGQCQTFCQPTMAYAQPQGQIMGSMQAPAVASRGVAASGSASGVYSIGAGGTTVIDMRTTEVDNTGEIIWAAALGMGMQAPNSYPVMIPRNNRTTLDPFYYQEGLRDSDLQPRPHAQ